MPLGPTELIVILLIIVVLFGAGRLADVGGAFGKGIREFRQATREDRAPASPQPIAAVAVPSAPEGAACPACAATTRQGQAFCGQCGASLTKAAA